MGFFRQEYWSGCLSLLQIFPTQGLNMSPVSSALQADSLTTEPSRNSTCQNILPFLGWTYIYIYIYICIYILYFLFIHSSINRQLGRFYILAIIKSYCCKHGYTNISLRPCFQFYWVYTQSRNAGPYGNSMFNFLKNCHNVFYSSSNILHSHQDYTTVSIFPHTHQHLLLSVFVVVFFNSSHPNWY